MPEEPKGQCPRCGKMELVNVVALDNSCIEAEYCHGCGGNWWFQIPRTNMDRLPGADDAGDME